MTVLFSSYSFSICCRLSKIKIEFNFGELKEGNSSTTTGYAMMISKARQIVSCRFWAYGDVVRNSKNGAI